MLHTRIRGVAVHWLCHTAELTPPSPSALRAETLPTNKPQSHAVACVFACQKLDSVYHR